MVSHQSHGEGFCSAFISFVDGIKSFVREKVARLNTLCNIALYTLSLGTQHLIIQCNELFDILIMRSRLLTMLFVECL